MDLETVHGSLMLDDSQLLASEEFILKMNSKGSLSKFIPYFLAAHMAFFSRFWDMLAYLGEHD